LKPLLKILRCSVALGRRAASYAGAAGLEGLPGSASGMLLLPFSLSFTYAAIDEYTMAYVFEKPDFAYLRETFHVDRRYLQTM
jgi:hypothetical protein